MGMSNQTNGWMDGGMDEDGFNYATGRMGLGWDQNRAEQRSIRERACGLPIGEYGGEAALNWSRTDDDRFGSGKGFSLSLLLRQFVAGIYLGTLGLVVTQLLSVPPPPPPLPVRAIDGWGGWMDNMDMNMMIGDMGLGMDFCRWKE